MISKDYPGYKFTWSFEPEVEALSPGEKTSEALEQLYKKRGRPEAHYREYIQNMKNREANMDKKNNK